MTYDRVIDILPALTEATQKGRLKWEVRSNGKNREFMVTIGEYIFEINYDADKAEKTIKTYLWDLNSNILDSARVKFGEDNYDEMYKNFRIIQKSAANIPSILSSIVEQLKASD